jgi:hypothetical protein
MKAGNFLLSLMFLTAIAVHATAQDRISYIIVKTAGGEVASFNPRAVNQQFIENSQWIFELKSGARYSYPLTDVAPFTVEKRTPGSGTAVQPVAASAWRVYDDGSALVIENPEGSVGRYAVYDLSGKLIKTGYASGPKISIPVPAGVCIVRAGLDGNARKMLKM